tara:strand:- start:5604 stop:5849 length:246 start_codon:yes stop_codon:yes gene_type:complete
MPKYRLIVDFDSPREEGQHLESLFNSFSADDEVEAERLVDAKVKELMYGGPYWTLVEDEDEDKPIADARDKHLIMQKGIVR